MAVAAVTFLVDQVNQVMIGYKDLISGAGTEFTLLQNELNVLKAALMDVATRKKKSEHIYRELEKQIKEVVYEVEESIDICLAKAQAKAKGTTFDSLKFLNPKRFNLANEMKSIREKKLHQLILKANNDFASVACFEKDEDESGGTEDHDQTILKRDPPIIRRNRIVGFEDEVDTISGYLMTTTEELDVIPIIGIPGQGKTTLARMVYEKEEIRNRFPVRIWINISPNFNITDVFLQILGEFMPSQSKSDNPTTMALAQGVGECLQKERFLLVLDDMWNVDAWNQIKKVLPLKNGASKVLITSRLDKIVSSPRRIQLRFLEKEESWRLLQCEVFGDEGECPKVLRPIGKEIALRCDGVPLAVVVVGGILARSSSWAKVLKDMTDFLQEKGKLQRVTDVVELSYRTLPEDLRECFLYLGVFPQDYEIPAKMLAGLWISEGFILLRDGTSLEDSVEQKVNDLVSRNLLRVEKRNHMGKPKTFRVAKTIREVCISKSMEDNLFQEMTEKMGSLKPSASDVHKLHRLCFHSIVMCKFLSTNPNAPHLRSFLCFYNQPIELEQQRASVIVPEGFPRLRILESKSIKLHHFPENLTKLIHLRYLTIYVQTLEVLPGAITQLWNLLSLVVETESRTITMKANVWKMIRLRHLKTKAAIVLDDKRCGGKAGSLHTLTTLSPQSCTKISQRAPNLKTLGISGELAPIFDDKLLADLHHLEKLKLVNSLTHQLHGLPSRDVFPPNLSRLTLANTHLDWNNMSTLAMIKTLVALKLKDNAFVGMSWKANGYDFPTLQLLLIVTTDLVLWDASKDTFPNLNFLVVNNCENLRKIPECTGIHLQSLEVDHVRSSAIESAKKIAETQGEFGVQIALKIGLPSDK